MNSLNRPIPASVQESDDDLKKNGAKEKDGKLILDGASLCFVESLNREVDHLRKNISWEIDRLTTITGRDEFKSIPIPRSSSNDLPLEKREPTFSPEGAF